MSEFVADALLFDMDGTLIDSTAAVEVAWRQLCARYDIDAEAVLAVTHGVPARDTIAKFWAPEHRADAFAWIEDAECRLLDGVVPIPGASQLVDQLVGDGARWAIVTSATPRLARARLEAAGVRIPDLLITADQVEKGKPSPDAYLLAADRLGIRPEASIVVEDAPAGIRAGLAAGAQVVVRGAHGGDDAAGLVVIDDYLGAVIETADPIRGRWR